MYYLGNINKDEFVTTAIQLGYPMSTKKVDHITAAAMWQESNISKKSQKIVLRYLSNFFSTRLVIPEYFIDKLGQNNVILQCDSFILVGKINHFLDKTNIQDFN